MASIQVLTSQNVEIEYKIAPLSVRIASTVIDWLIFLAYVMLVVLLLQYIDLFQSSIVVASIIIIPIFFYPLLCELLLNGQSIGKRVLKTRVVQINGEIPDTGQFLLRWIFRFVDITLSIGGVAALLVLITRRKQRLGDLIAGTTIIMIEASIGTKVTMQQVLDKHQQEADREVVFPEAVKLKEAEMLIVKKVINRVVRKPQKEQALATETAQILQERLQITHKEASDLVFLQTLLRDYIKLTR
ncbi:MAG: RDD family protein [Bernardetiaceae bacterium]|nr:RDD family protein [Bernardetiaceae bacterium]